MWWSFIVFASQTLPIIFWGYVECGMSDVPKDFPGGQIGQNKGHVIRNWKGTEGLALAAWDLIRRQVLPDKGLKIWEGTTCLYDLSPDLGFYAICHKPGLYVRQQGQEEPGKFPSWLAESPWRILTTASFAFPGWNDLCHHGMTSCTIRRIEWEVRN